MSRATITVFGSNRPEKGSDAYEQAWELGKGLAAAGFAICNGGYGGTMRATADGASYAKGEVIGITVRPWGPPNEFVTRRIEHDDLIPRLIDLVERGDAYVVLPGGTGTLLEIALVLELMHKGSRDARPLWFLGTQWSPVLRAAFVDQAPAKWVGGHTRIPDYAFFETPAQVVAAAEAHFG